MATASSNARTSSPRPLGWARSRPESDARQVFRRLDEDADGFVTTHDLLEAIREYHFDDAPDSTGSWLLGPLDPA